MRQAIHIFRKDARHLAIPIALLIALMIAYDMALIQASRAYNKAPYDSGAEAPALELLLLMMVPLYAWFLIAMAVQDDAPGDTQFWVTRPYKRISLWISKVLFVVVFVNVPLFVSDITILSATGLWSWSDIPDLLSRQLVVSLWLVIPAFAIAGATRGLAQFATFLVSCCVGAIVLGTVAPAFLHEGIAVTASFWARAILCGSVLLALAAVNAYATRRILISGVLIALAFFSLDAPVLWAAVAIALSSPAHQVRAPTRTGHQIGVSMDLHGIASEKARVIDPNLDFVGFDLPIHLRDLPTGVTRLSVLGKASLTGEGGKRAQGNAINKFQLAVPGVIGVPQPSSVEDKVLQIVLKRSDYVWLAGKAVKLQLSVDGNAYVDTPFMRIPLERRSFEIAGIGRCDPSSKTWFVCRTALRDPKPFLCYIARGRTQLSDLYQDRSSPVDSIFPVSAGLNPVETWQLRAALSDSDPGRELVFLNPGKPIPLIGSAVSEIRVPELSSTGQ